MFLTALALIVLLVCSDDSIIIVVMLSLSSFLLCPSHLIDMLCSAPVLPMLGTLTIDISNVVLSLTAASFDGKGLL